MNRRWPVVTLAVSVVVLLAAGGMAAWATSYDQRNSGHLLPGTEIEGIPVGGMRSAEAVAVLREKLEDPLHRPLQVRAGTFETTTTPWELGLRVDVRAAVRRAMGETDGNLAARVWKRMFSKPERVVAAEPTWRPDQLDAAMTKLADQVAAEPQEATIDASSGWVRIAPGKPGKRLDVERARQAIFDSIELTDGFTYLPTEDIPPKQGADAVNHVILIRTGENRLYLYEKGTIAKSWPVATGAAGFSTPTGTWKIVEKIKDPVWYNPGTPWARGMPARIGPGPYNPLGTHALALDAPAILIHGTSDTGSIGYSVSHGCVRMLPADEVELFEKVQVGTPVVVVQAGEPRARGSAPVTADPNQAAAVQF